MKILDTQIISYASKGQSEYLMPGETISSITASEFLQLQNPSHTHANYYVPILGTNHRPYSRLKPILQKRNRKFTKLITDSIVINFGTDHPSIVEYSNLALSLTINNQDASLFYDSICTLPKEKQKLIRGRFNFLLKNRISCVPINKEIIDAAHGLLFKFEQTHNPKNNFRNTWNDIMILSTAMASSAVLVTEDNELNRFAASQYPCQLESIGNMVTMDFSVNRTTILGPQEESKGYINRGWAASFRKYGSITP